MREILNNKKNLPDAKSFPYDEYLEIKAQRDEFIDQWAKSAEPKDVPVIIMPAIDRWNTNFCKDRELFLRCNLWDMAKSAEWKSDHVFPHLQPWYGVGLYASAFGAKYVWLGEAAPQTHPIFRTVKETENIQTPEVGVSGPMKEVLDRIKWYREITNDRLPIGHTDTQSPCNTASLLVETNEYFMAMGTESERLEPLFKAITDTLISFSDMQSEAIGPELSSYPGHQMISHKNWKGISLSDDNMTMLSPEVYERVLVPHLNRLGEHFGGIALHSCGTIAHNIPAYLKVKNLNQVEHAICCIEKDSDPGPNEPQGLRDGYRGSNVIVKVRMNKNEVELLDRFLAPDLKCALVITGVESKEESEKVYNKFKDRIKRVQDGFKLRD